MSDPIRDIIRMQVVAQKQREQSERYKQKRLERQRKGLPEPSRTVVFLRTVLLLLVIAAVVGGVVIGAIALIRYGYAQKWWW
jgi:hypothetical protein